MNAVDEELAASPVFADLTLAERTALFAGVTYRSIRGGDVLIRQGDASGDMYVVIRGRLRAYVRRGGVEHAVGEIARGEPVGEMAIITGEPRAATVRALRDSVVACFSGDLVERLLEEHPRALVRFARLVIKRGRVTADDRSRAAPKTIAIVGTDPTAPTSALAHHLSAALAEIGPTVQVDASCVDGHFGSGAAQTSIETELDASLAAWLDSFENTHRFVIYRADPDPTEWTMRSIRQADRVLLVASAEGSPELGPIETAIADANLDAVRHLELVLVRESSGPPRGTVLWLSARGGMPHHHVALGEREDYARLARCLSATATGLVLSGGGARGFAHIGVIRAMRELGIPIDFVGGASAGAIVGALAANRTSHADMLALNRRAFVDDHAMTASKDLTLPLVSLVSGRKAVTAFDRMFGDRRIEDSEIPFFCVSTNLTRAEGVTHEAGSVARCVRASCSPPGVAPPMFRDGELLVDGGVLNNLPVDEMMARCPGRVIAVDVCERMDLTTDSPYCDSLSGWRLLLRRMTPGAKRYDIPSIASILTRTAMVSSINRQDSAMKKVDKYLHPPVEKFGSLEWDAIEHVADVGYRYALTELSDWCSA